jgi:cytochrome c2
MYKKRNYLATIFLLAALIISSAATMPQQEEKHEEYKNLKVLPKKISHDELSATMKSWNNALGVKCNFCHAQQKDNPKKLDFASDAKSEKEMARSMFKMTAKINKKYFGHEELENGQAVLEVSCNTCHRGKTHPGK